MRPSGRPGRAWRSEAGRIAFWIVVLLALAGCTGADASVGERKPTPVGTREATPEEEQNQAIVKVCARATMINTMINDADWQFTQQLTSPDEWLASLLDAEDQAQRLAEMNADEPYGPALEEFSALRSGFDEIPPTEANSRDWDSPLLFDICEEASAAYGVGGGGAVGG